MRADPPEACEPRWPRHTGCHTQRRAIDTAVARCDLFFEAVVSAARSPLFCSSGQILHYSFEVIKMAAGYCQQLGGVAAGKGLHYGCVLVV